MIKGGRKFMEDNEEKKEYEILKKLNEKLKNFNNNNKEKDDGEER